MPQSDSYAHVPTRDLHGWFVASHPAGERILPRLPLREGPGVGCDAAPGYDHGSIEEARQAKLGTPRVDEIQKHPRDPNFPQPSPSGGEGERTPPCHRDAFTILELLTTLALIIVVMGLMVSLARYVRSNAADQMTRSILLDLETELANYQSRYNAYPPANLIDDAADENQLANAMRSTGGKVVRMLNKVRSPQDPLTPDLPSSETALRDAWGRAIGYLPHHHPLIGMAPQNRPFFFSAGPDGRYLTRQDNLYSYEQTRPNQRIELGLGKNPATKPAIFGGQRE